MILKTRNEDKLSEELAEKMNQGFIPRPKIEDFDLNTYLGWTGAFKAKLMKEFRYTNPLQPPEERLKEESPIPGWDHIPSATYQIEEYLPVPHHIVARWQSDESLPVSTWADIVNRANLGREVMSVTLITSL
jgi:hypothetical protein